MADDMRVLLIANRGEVAVRVARTAADLGYRTVAIHTDEDAGALHTRIADSAVLLPGAGPAAYLDIDAVLAAAAAANATHVHPGWGFLSEDAGFASACIKAGLVFIGPSPDVLDALADKARARQLAVAHDVAVPRGTTGGTTLDDALQFAASLPAGTSVVVKAVAGGGGRGMRVVDDVAALPDAYDRCRAEAEASFGRADVYVEELISGARHVEVQIIGDAGGGVTHLFERDCSIQRRHQKLVEITPAPGLHPLVRAALVDAAIRLARAVGYQGVGTFEFLVDARDAGTPDGRFWFIEANPRLQVEHTITEELLGIDLVAVQLHLADGGAISELGLPDTLEPPRGYVIQARINAEVMRDDGTAVAATGVITSIDFPGGPGIRCDAGIATGDTVSGRFDSLLAKIVVRGGDFPRAVARTSRVLEQVRFGGVRTNTAFLQAILGHADVRAGDLHTRFVDEHMDQLLTAIDPDPEERGSVPVTGPDIADGMTPVVAPMAGVVVAVDVAPGDAMHPSSTIAVLEAMKMQHVVPAGIEGIVRDVDVAPGSWVDAGALLAVIEPAEIGQQAATAEENVDLALVRPDLAEVLARRGLLADSARPDAVERRHESGHRTARENVADLCDPDSFSEIGGFIVAAQVGRRGMPDLIRSTPADGVVAGIGRVNGDVFDDDRARCAVMSYDYTVLAGTQGLRNHKKQDRLFGVVEQLRLPIVLFAEGGGGRPGDDDYPMVAGLDITTFHSWASLSGLVPMVGVVAGRCFAGNAALLGCCDVIIATADSSIGMGGPAMIEGGGLGVHHPDDVGPVAVQAPNGVIDVVVADDAAAVATAKQYLAYFQGSTDTWECADQRVLRHAIPENRVRVYDVRRVVHGLFDTGSVLELRRAFGVGIVTALARVEGRPVGVLANDPAHLGGAIDAPAAEKASRFLQLCDAFDLPVVSLCDTPGFMVGPHAERDAQVRKFASLFVNAASITVPFITVVLRKGYGLGAQAMAGGSFHAPLLTLSWPTGEFGGMGLEGAVRLAYRKELAAVESEAEQTAMFDQLVAASYERGKALNVAAHFELDDVVDPAETRGRIVETLRACPPAPVRTGKKRPCIDTW